MEKIVLWGVIASPYLLKMQSLLDHAGHEWERWPEQAGRWQALRMAVRLQRARRSRAVRRFPAMPGELDEYPALPFYTQDQRIFYYDSTSLAFHLDSYSQRHTSSLVPQDPRLAFVCQLIDEAFDEFGLYMVHHMRWVGSAHTTPMGEMTALEFRKLLPAGIKGMVARRLVRRQVRRCPYLFSVAPEGYLSGVSSERTPPSRPGFPPTHDMLDLAWREYLAAMEEVLAVQPYLLGERFTLADASAYGQLGMNLVDGAATDLLKALAPRTYRWLCAIRDGEHVDVDGELSLSPALQPLLRAISKTFMPLMVQNENAYLQALSAGENLFNEEAFDQGRALYDGQLLDRPYRAVIKTFQVRVWRELRVSWRALDQSQRADLENLLPPGAGLLFDEATSPMS